jgi:hypothetical protein
MWGIYICYPGYEVQAVILSDRTGTVDLLAATAALRHVSLVESPTTSNPVCRRP